MIANIAEVARIFEFFGALLILVVHCDFFIWAIQMVWCRPSAIWSPPIESARQERVIRKARKKIGKIKILSKLQEIRDFLILCALI